MSKHDSQKNGLALNHKVTFLNSVFLFAGIVAFGMGFYRWQVSAMMGSIDFAFAACSFVLVFYLNRHRKSVGIISSIALTLSYLLFTAIYLLASYNTTRISLFFLLSASAFFLKGRKVGLVWLVFILATIVMGHFLPGVDTGYSGIDIVTCSVYLMALFFILRNYEIFQNQANKDDWEDVEVEITRSRQELNEERKLTEERLRLTSKVFENILEGILITDANGIIIEVNESFCKITGYTHAELVGKNPRILQSGHQNRAFYETMWYSITTTGHWSGELWNRNHDGDLFAEWLSISAIQDDAGQVTHYVGICSDITLLKQHEKQLERIAHYDALTGIPNRTLLNDRMRQAIARTSREQNMMAVCYLDLDGFKPINDQMGHEAGDHVLIEIAQRLQKTMRGGDTVARLGGDEFVILLLGLERGDECITTLERLLAAISEPIDLKGTVFTLSASIGVSIYPLDDEDTDTLLRHADQAMYISKQSGKNRFHIYDPALDQRARNQQKLFKSIQQGLQENQFELYYQPKVDLRTRQLIGAEALIRWNHPELGLLPPAGFLPSIGNTELDIAIGEWVIATALRQLDTWRVAGLDIEVSINISAYHLESPNFIGRLREQLAQHPDILAQHLEIEVLETVALEDINKVSHIIEECKKLGIGFALDDFGTGYSSLSYLSSLPIDTLKIDQSFMRDLILGKRDHAIVLGIIALSKAFELKTVAEGIETDDHFQSLLEMGCDIGQGYGIARPMPAAAMVDWGRQRSDGKHFSTPGNSKKRNKP